MIMSSTNHIVPSDLRINVLTSHSANEAYYTFPVRSESYASSLPLQMLLYFNLFYFPLWLLVEIVALYLKFDRLSTFYQVIIICILICMSIVEAIRIYLGYSGNLLERMPDLAAHWILTVVIQLPQILFLLSNEATIISPLERIVCSILTIFIGLELIISFLAIKTNIRLLMTKFKLQQIQGPNAYHQEMAIYDNQMFKDD